MGQEKIWTVYCHVHIETGKRYVGVTTRGWARRWYEQTSKARRGWTNSPFFAVVRELGEESFSHEVLETCRTAEEGRKAEIRWIRELGTRDPSRGFNIDQGGRIAAPVPDGHLCEIHGFVPVEKCYKNRYRGDPKRYHLSCKLCQKRRDAARRETTEGRRAKADALKRLRARRRRDAISPGRSLRS